MIGERLQELRKDRGMSQEELAKFLGVSHYTVSSYECNRSDPDDNSKVMIAKLFGVSIDYLLGLIDESVHYNREHRIVQLPHGFSDEDYAEVKNYIGYIEHKNSKKNDKKD